MLNLKQSPYACAAKVRSASCADEDRPGEVKDIQTVSDMEILNPDHVICTLDDGANLARADDQQRQATSRPNKIVLTMRRSGPSSLST
ncbi:MAG: hypothetical protein R3C30_12630 [Hyphomonadaceae bacterium]